MDTRKIPLSLFWYQQDIPEPVQGCLQTWKDHPRFSTAVYGCKDAVDFFETTGQHKERVAYETCGPFAMASDYFRLFILYARGGIYIDANWAQITDILPWIEQNCQAGQSGVLVSVNEAASTWNDPATDFMLAKNTDILLNGIMYFTNPQDPFLKIACEICTMNIQSKATESIAFASGSGVLTLLHAIRGFETRTAYLRYLEELVTYRYFGHSLDQVVRHTIAAIQPYNFDMLKTMTAGINVVPGLSLGAHIRRDGLGQLHKDHWYQLKGSLYRSDT